MFVRTHGLKRAGAMRALAEQISSTEPDLIVISEIDDGGALAISTRLDRQWAYRGGQAILWSARFAPESVQESYLPPALPALQWRGILRIDLRYRDVAFSLLATRFATDRSRARDLRFTRKTLREARDWRIILAITNPPRTGRNAFRDLGFAAENASASADLMLAARGCDLRSNATIAGGDNLGTQMIAHVAVGST